MRMRNRKKNENNNNNSDSNNNRNDNDIPNGCPKNTIGDSNSFLLIASDSFFFSKIGRRQSLCWRLVGINEIGNQKLTDQSTVYKVQSNN